MPEDRVTSKDSARRTCAEEKVLSAKIAPPMMARLPSKWLLSKVMLHPFMLEMCMAPPETAAMPSNRLPRTTV